MLIGYGRVSTADQNPAHQIDALRRAGVAEADIHIDTASGAKASRPKLDLVLQLLRAGDTLVITRLDRLGRSVVHLVLLGAELRDRSVGLRVIEQGIDTSSAEGRAMFGMLSVLAELQRELIVANTRDGLAAARARGRTGGRRPKLTPDQARTAQRLYDEGEHTVAQIAAILGVKRSTLYGHLDKSSVGARPRAAKTSTPAPDSPAATSTAVASRPSVTSHGAETSSRASSDGLPRPMRTRIRHPNEPVSPAESDLRGRPVQQRVLTRVSHCPTCGHEPVEARDRWQQRHDLAITWLYADPERPGAVFDRRHCVQCQPHQQLTTVVCPLCGDGPMIAGDLAAQLLDAGIPPEPLRRWLDAQGWHDQQGIGLICGEHPART